MSYCIDLPKESAKKQVSFPHQQFQDDFLEVMQKVFIWSRTFGVIGLNNNCYWNAWFTIVLTTLFVTECVAIYRLVALLAGINIGSSEDNVSHFIAGTTFYTSSFVCLILSSRLSLHWNELSELWTCLEKNVIEMIPIDVTLKKRMIIVMCTAAVGAFVEHCTSIVSSVGSESSPSLLLQQYVLSSHAFLVSPSYYSVWLGLSVSIMSVIATILWSFQDLLIILISMGLASRYYRLNLCVSNLCSRNKIGNKWIKSTEITKVYTWRKLREAYVKQAMLVRKLDKAIGGLIIFSSIGNLYFICLHVFLGITRGPSGGYLKFVYYLVSFGWLCLRFICVVMAAADVCVHSNQALPYLNSCSGGRYNVEIERLQVQLSKDYVALSGLGLFYLNRELLLQMIGAIVTYELMLVQFYDVTVDEENPDRPAV